MNEAEMDDQAWKEIVCHLDKGEIGEAKTAFLTRCSESAIEGIRDFEKEDEKRRAALEDVARTGADARNYMASEPQGTPKGKFFKALNNLARITKAQAKLDALNEGKP